MRFWGSNLPSKAWSGSRASSRRPSTLRITGQYRLMDSKDGRYAWGFDLDLMVDAVEE